MPNFLNLIPQFNFWLSSEFSEDKDIALYFSNSMTTSCYFYSEIDTCFLNFIKLGEERNHFLLMDTYCHCVRRDNPICALWVHNHWSSILWIFSNTLLIFKSCMYSIIFVAVYDTTAKVTLEREGLFDYHILIIIHNEEKTIRIGT